MGLVETEAIVLRTYRLAEADKIAVCLTEKAGLVRGVARGARRLKSRFGASLEPFTLSQIAYFEKEGRELVSIKHSEILQSYFDLSAEPEALSTLEYFGELVLSFSPPSQRDEKLFRMVRACVDAVAAVAAAADESDKLTAVSNYFELWMLRLSGFLPDLTVCGACGRKLQALNLTVEVRAGRSAICGACSDRRGGALDLEAFRHLSAMRVQNPQLWAEGFMKLPAQSRRRLLETARQLVRGVLEREPTGARLLAAEGKNADAQAVVK